MLSDHVPISASLVGYLHLNSINSQPIQKVQFEKKKVKWDSYDKESILSLYTEPLSVKLSETSFDAGIDELYNNLLRIVWSVSEASLKVKRVCTGKSQKCRKTKRIYSRAVCEARNKLNHLLVARKKNDSEELKLDFVKRRKEYRKIVRNELKLERDKRITELCAAVEVDEKSFWKLIKSKRSSAQFGSFLVDGKLTNSPVEIINMWFEHIKCLGISSTQSHYDSVL